MFAALFAFRRKHSLLVATTFNVLTIAALGISFLGASLTGPMAIAGGLIATFTYALAWLRVVQPTRAERAAMAA